MLSKRYSKLVIGMVLLFPFCEIAVAMCDLTDYGTIFSPRLWLFIKGVWGICDKIISMYIAAKNKTRKGKEVTKKSEKYIKAYRMYNFLGALMIGQYLISMKALVKSIYTIETMAMLLGIINEEH
jgi:hypothetical protein